MVARRWPLAEIILAPTPVQGDDAPPLICQSIEDLNLNGLVDVIIIARGGGSIEDLWAFNDELVARAIFASRVPIVSAIGHETDVTIADMVADRRAPTPSAAAELAVPDIREVRERVRQSAQALLWATRRGLEQRVARLRQAESALAYRSPANLLRAQQTKLSALATRAYSSVNHDLSLRSERVQARELQVRALDPLAVLARGFSVTTRTSDGRVVRAMADAANGVRVRTRVPDGAFESVVVDI